MARAKKSKAYRSWVLVDDDGEMVCRIGTEQDDSYETRKAARREARTFGFHVRRARIIVY